MTYASFYDLGRIGAAPSEGSVIVRPKRRPATPKSGVMFVHGAGSTSLYCLLDDGKQGRLTRKIASAGYTGWSHDNGGPQTWGNDLALLRMSSGRDALRSQPGVTSGGKIALVSASMGGLNSLAWIGAWTAGGGPSPVSCVVSVIPVLDLTDIHTNNRGGFASLINAAYGGAYSEASYGATHNPMTMAQAGRFTGIPMLIFYGTSDTICLPGRAQAFAAAVGSSVTLVPLAAGHDLTAYDLVDHDLAVDFLKAHA